MADNATRSYILENAAEWARRERKWHRRLEWERRWKWIGAGAPPVVAAAGGLVVHLWGHQTLVVVVAPLLLGLIGLRSLVASGRISEGKYEEVWAIADRVSKVYRSLRARLDDGEDPALLRVAADAVEAEARLGVPEALRGAIRLASGTGHP